MRYFCKDSHSPYCQGLEYEQLGVVQVLIFVVYDDDFNIGFCHLLTIISLVAVFQHIEASHLIFCCSMVHLVR